MCPHLVQKHDAFSGFQTALLIHTQSADQIEAQSKHWLVAITKCVKGHLLTKQSYPKTLPSRSFRNKLDRPSQRESLYQNVLDGACSVVKGGAIQVPQPPARINQRHEGIEQILDPY
jgi:hypothetical protein